MKIIKRYWKVFLSIAAVTVLFTFFVAVITNYSIPRFRVSTDNDWIGYYGAIVGGMLTLIGVCITIENGREEKKEELRKSIIPIFYTNVVHNGNTDGADFITLDDVEPSRIEKFSLYLTNIGLKGAKNLKIYTYADGKSFGDVGVSVLVDVNKEYNITIGAKVAELNSVSEKSNCKHEITIAWSYQDLIGNQYEQHCDIKLYPENKDNDWFYNVNICEIKEAKFIGYSS